jgi:peroxiredoxin
MSQSPARPGPQIPPSLARTPVADETGTPRRRAARRPAPARSSATAGKRAAKPRQPAVRALLDPGRLGTIALVIALVAAAIWLDRDLGDPVAGYGIVPQPGASEVAVLQSALTVGDLVPNFRLLATDGEVVELAELRGQPVLVQFWTTWCLECTNGIPVLQQLSEGYANRVLVLGIDIGEGAGRVDRAASDHGGRYPMLLDADEEVSRHYGAYDLPVTIVIDADGVISSIESGPTTAGSLQERLDAALGE